MFQSKKIALLTGAATLFSAAAPAYAAGTASGTSIQNTATVTYNVGNVVQSPVTSNTDVFTVDRKVNLTVTQKQTGTTQVSPGQTAAVTTFELVNTSNATLDFILTAAQLTGGTAPNGGTDSFNTTNTRIFVDNGDGIFNAAEDTQVFVDELAADGRATIFVVSDVPLNTANGAKAAVSLTAQAAEAGTTGTQGAAVTQTAGANNKGGAADTVFADAAGSDDAAKDGRSSARSDYTVAAAVLTAAKTSTTIADGLGGTAPNAKSIPGATVQYCIAVTNAANTATATNIVVNDVVPATLAVQQGTIRVNATVNAAGLCSGGTLTANASSGNTVSGTLSDIAAGVTRALSFEALIN